MSMNVPNPPPVAGTNDADASPFHLAAFPPIHPESLPDAGRVCRRTCFTPGRPWYDTEGKRIQAHGGSIIVVDGVYYWYGENKERTTPDGSTWHWGVRAYRSTDLYNWEDCGLIIPPEPDDPSSPLHPAAKLDRPHIVFNAETGLFVCWVKVMSRHGQRSSVLVADNLLGPYRMAHRDFKPLGMNAGDFDLVVDPTDAKGYYYYERVHSELICADLTTDYTDVTGYYSTHFPRLQPPYVREAPAYFERGGHHYLITSGTTGYLPNPSMVATAPSYHGPWSEQGDPHAGDITGTSYRSQISSVFRHPGKQDLYIALADRWLPAWNGDARLVQQGFAERFRPMGGQRADAETILDPAPSPAVEASLYELNGADTAVADYVWLPIRFDDDRVRIDWHDEWRVEDFD
ncbi:family 43 glycosylhydrolase [Actinomyces succiniciruminis]|uniref:Licheninase n=1 Tax=Actinomyces succiniciruminis TaxID=1522002 RepID=A0A1L7RKN4_9ACTO|nr:family 43 glycosylhydrolase [Actinomyces succiniciruminis]CED89948.1 Licheninase [Actinomyces succiniciruminis]